MQNSVTVVCVNHGNYLGMGQEYVARMRSMVSRYMPQPYNFVCLEDEGSYKGWWSKIELFRPGRFTGRVVYFDLDSVIVAPLVDLIATKGIINLLDWGWLTRTMCSSVMVWDAGEHEEIFTKFDHTAISLFRGDQDWITHLGGWPILPSQLCRSYRYHCVEQPPAGCVHVSMHGNPKPHEIKTGWVPTSWV